MLVIAASQSPFEDAANSPRTRSGLEVNGLTKNTAAFFARVEVSVECVGQRTYGIKGIAV